MKQSLIYRIASIFIILLFFSACGRWDPATSSDLRGTLEQKKGGDRYRFLLSDGKQVESSGKNLSIENEDLLVRKDNRVSRYPLNQVQEIEKYRLLHGRTWGLILGITLGVLGATAAAAIIDIGNDTGS